MTLLNFKSFHPLQGILKAIDKGFSVIPVVSVSPVQKVVSLIIQAHKPIIFKHLIVGTVQVHVMQVPVPLPQGLSSDFILTLSP